MSYAGKSGLMNAVLGKDQEALKKAYYGTDRISLRLNGVERLIIGREDIERAKADAFLQLVRRDYEVLSSSFNNKRVVVELKNRRGVSKEYLKRLHKSEMIVYHIGFYQPDWDQYYPEIKTHVSAQDLTLKVDRYEAIRVADWLGGMTLEFSDRHDLGFRDVNLQQLVR